MTTCLDTFYCDIDKNKNSLYVINSTMRNPGRLLDFYYFFSLIIHKFGANNPISSEDFINFAKKSSLNLVKMKGETLKKKVCSFSKKFSELKSLGLIDFKIKDEFLYFNETEFVSDQFNEYGYTIDTLGFDYYETNSNFLLFVLSKRKTLNFITLLIQEVEKIWSLEYKGKRKGISNVELEFIYVLIPFFAQKKEHNIKYIASFITDYRNKYNKTNKSSSYRNFLIKELNIYKSYNPFFKFINIDSARDYIDVLFRTLDSTHCFKILNQYNMHSVVINNDFFSKLSYFITTPFDIIKEAFINKTFVKDLKSFEKKYYKLNNDNIFNPITYRYDRQYKDKKNVYLSYDKTLHENSLTSYSNKYSNKNSLTWFEFEDLNNLLATHFVKFSLKQTISETNLKYAIKIDDFGSIKNSTSCGVPDLSIVLENYTIIVESSLLHGLISRKNEVPSVIAHAEKLYREDSKKRPVICFVVFNKTFIDLENDFINHNRANFDFEKNILYYPINYNTFYDFMISNPISIMELINETKQKLSIITSEIKLKSQTSSIGFKDFGLIN